MWLLRNVFCETTLYGAGFIHHFSLVLIYLILHTSSDQFRKTTGATEGEGGQKRAKRGAAWSFALWKRTAMRIQLQSVIVLYHQKCLYPTDTVQVEGGQSSPQIVTSGSAQTGCNNLHRVNEWRGSRDDNREDLLDCTLTAEPTLCNDHTNKLLPEFFSIKRKMKITRYILYLNISVLSIMVTINV